MRSPTALAPTDGLGWNGSTVASAPFQRVYEEFGLTVERVMSKARELVGGTT